MNLVLDRWNGVAETEAAGEILPCNGSQAWAAELAALRPFASEAALFAAADAVWARLSQGDQQQAFDSHPRLGQKHAVSATGKSLEWSAGEQSTLSPAQAEQQALAEANRLYEERFGRIFLLCATGKSTADILAALHVRLNNDSSAEWREGVEQQRRITQLRLRKWLGLPAAACEDV